MRATPGMGLSEFAISWASARGGLFRCLASSKHSGEATSPIASFGGRSVTIGTSVLYLSWIWCRSDLRIRSSTVLYTFLLCQMNLGIIGNRSDAVKMTAVEHRSGMLLNGNCNLLHSGCRTSKGLLEGRRA